ncbi:PTS glucose transporter subunit IIA [Paenibacillus forsythiae]|uniref:PTS sugar transporter subunit IIA n=1 Tax=Paenibacillus forsythiae TaxID=365616 RepID=UPI0004BA18BA|nr:PTS glucose transporter subunit IIA [Paenibacillus forsythiae]
MLSPISGTLVELGEVPDPAFAEKQMGDGIAIQPDEGKVYAPFDAVVAHVMEKSKHAVILEHASGVQVLIHVGIDTVSLKGEGFALSVRTGDQVKAGQLLIEFDPETIRRAGLSTLTPVIIPNGIEGVLDLNITSSGNVTAAADRIMKVSHAVANHA